VITTNIKPVNAAADDATVEKNGDHPLSGILSSAEGLQRAFRGAFAASHCAVDRAALSRSSSCFAGKEERLIDRLRKLFSSIDTANGNVTVRSA
jgi:hypothetical protein